ncbi:uncharacterized protein LOC135339139 isoform X2 [Halichondria panicea]|uniref:uncharacterized protein LOC135339139 isoform X2 n=1 Tax=Halichondria panicea TaxID=6063 RepID=UPI00312B8275
MDKSLTSFTFLFMAGSFIIAVKAQFTVQPLSVERAEGLEAVFRCRYQAEGFTDNYFWYINNVVVGPDTETIRARRPSFPGGSTTLTILATLQHNNSIVYCSAVIINGTDITLADSSTASLVVHETVLTPFIVAPNTITVMWNALPLTDYCVDITESTLDSTETVVIDSLCGFTNEYIFMYSDNSVCARFTVTPTDGEMRGTTSELCTGLFTRAEGSGEQHRILETKRNKLVKFRATVPSCTRFTRYRVDSDLLTPSIDLPITDPLLFDGSLSFSLPTDKMTEYSVTLTDENGIDLVFENISISTFDVQDLLVSECPGGGICVSIEYVEGTLSPGALVCVIRVVNEVLGVLDFANMKLVTIPRNSIENFTIPVSSGEYRVIAFDLESNHLPNMPISMVAISQDIMTVNSTGEDITSPPPRESISATKLTNGEVEVTCCDSALNCLVLFQSTIILDRVLVGFINASSTSTVLSLNDTFGDGYVVVYSWNSLEFIFEGEVSLIIQLDLLTSAPTTCPTAAPTIPPTSDPQTDPTPPDMESLLTSVIAAAITGLVILLLLVVTAVGIVVVILRKRRQNEVEVPESDRRVDWSSTFAEIEQPNEAYAPVLKRNIAYEQTKKPRGQRVNDSQAPATTEGEYESIEPVHVYEDVLPQGKASRANYVNIN